MPAVYVGQSAKSGNAARQIGKWVDNVLGPGYHKFCPGEAWNPAINIYESRSSYLVVVDLAGIKAEGIDLRTEKGLLVLSGRRDAPGLNDADSDTRCHLLEIDHGKFSRRVELPQTADVDAISASYRNGFLWIRIPKKH